MRIRYLRDTLNGNEQDLRHKWDSIELLDKSNNSVTTNAIVTASHDMIGDLDGVLKGLTVLSSNSIGVTTSTYTPGLYECTPWVTTTYLDINSFKSNSIGNSQSTSFTITHNCPEGTIVGTNASLKYATSTESGCDFLKIKVNGTEEVSESGIVNWTNYELKNLKEGENTIELIYQKDSSRTGGNDSVYISEISISNPGSIEGLDYREEYLLVDLGEVIDVATVKVKHNKNGLDVKYYNKIEVSEDGIEWVTLFNNMDDISSSDVETTNGREFDIADMIKFSIIDGYVNGYPTCINFDNLPSTIDQSLCNLPYRPSDEFALNKKWDYDISKFNGYLSSITSRIASGSKIAATNLPLRFSTPLSKSFWQMNQDIVDGYPSLLMLDPNVDYNPVIIPVSDEHYVTPLRAKILIHKYMKEYMGNRGKTQTHIVSNLSIEEKNQRLILNWENPVDDPHWNRTLIYKSEVGYVEVDRETNDLILPSDCTYETYLLEEPGNEISKPLELTGLTNGKKYYFSFITISDTGVRNAYMDSCISGVPKILYTPQYGHFGEYIGKVDIPVGED